jgi:methyltransferase
VIGVFLLALVSLERLAELFWARANTARLLARGGHEVGAAHYPAIVALHFFWLFGLWIFAWGRPVEPLWLAVFFTLEALRVWTLVTLGRRWTTRIIIVPNETLVREGPYRFIAHPNYVVVIGEIAVLPLCFGLWAYAFVFTLLNAAVLYVRITAENEALTVTASKAKQSS